MNVELACCTSTLLREISDSSLKRKDIAMTYRLAMASSESVDWESVNKAIIERWSLSGLDYIKKLAWK